MPSQSKTDPSTQSIQESTSRRDFLRVMAASASATLLSGCGATAAQPTPTPVQPAAQPTLPAAPSHLQGIPSTLQGFSIFRDTLVEMPWPAIKEAAEQGAIILLPVGIIEAHGPHMGLGIDVYQSYVTTRLIRMALEPKGYQALIAPPCYWGMSLEVSAYPGTFSVRGSTLNAILVDIHANLRDWGFKYVFSLNSHGSSIHNRVFQETIQEVNEELGIEAYYISSKSAMVSNKRYSIFVEEPHMSYEMRSHLDNHAGAYETATMSILFPQDVDTALAKTLKPTNSFDPLGYWGDPASYDKIDPDELTRYAEDYAELTAQAIASFLKEKA